MLLPDTRTSRDAELVFPVTALSRSRAEMGFSSAVYCHSTASLWRDGVSLVLQDADGGGRPCLSRPGSACRAMFARRRDPSSWRRITIQGHRCGVVGDPLVGIALYLFPEVGCGTKGRNWSEPGVPLMRSLSKSVTYIALDCQQ
ncbi:hypothetical protein AHiyo1_43470 [Arthrobacter sp. Hiyo1]|nr:hypothetical protein AHiyo1_43470 [Arthrobacter sp. Hiyo1]